MITTTLHTTMDAASKAATQLDAALTYAAAGIPVFPCRPDKKPITTHGFKEATTDAATVRWWWTKHPAAIVGMPTGEASGVWVLDPDIYKPDCEWEKVKGTNTVAVTLTVATMRGGFHLYSCLPLVGILKNSESKIGKEIDTRGEGGYVCVPAPVGGYTVKTLAPVAPAPEWILELCSKAGCWKTDKPVDAAPKTPRPTPTAPGRIPASVLRIICDGVKEGERNGTALHIATQLRDAGLMETDAETYLLQFAEHCRPPMEEAEARKTLASAYTRAPRDPAQAQGVDPLAPVRSLAPDADLAAIGSALRAVRANLKGKDDLARTLAREEVLKILAPFKLASPARLVDAAFAADDAKDKTANTLTLTDPEPWTEGPIDGADLLSAIRAAVNRYVVVSEEQATAIALWIVHAHAIDSFDCTPYLTLTSATKRCGKTVTAGVIGTLAPRLLSTSNASEAAIFRCIEKYNPTLLLDEAETYIRNDADGLRGILNSGWTRGGTVMRTVGDDFDTKLFPTFCPKILALIGDLPDTLIDRSIRIQMRRRMKGETRDRIRAAEMVKDHSPLRRQAWTWAHDHADALRAADPACPNELNDRAADNWRPLLAIADLAGGGWGKVARTAALVLSAKSEGDTDTDGIHEQLLADIRSVFAARKQDTLPSALIATDLCGMDGHPWAEINHGRELTANRMTRLLRGFKIRAKPVRVGKDVYWGYSVSEFADAFARYLPPTTPPESLTSLQSAKTLEKEPFLPKTEDLHASPCKDSKNTEKGQKANENGTCKNVRLSDPPTAGDTPSEVYEAIPREMAL